MQRFIILLSIFILTICIFTGCNLPSSSNSASVPAQPTAAVESVEELVKTMQAEEPFVPETETNADEDLLIVRASDQQEPELPAEPTEVPTATPDPNREPPALPAVYQTDLLNKLDTPHEYEEDVCKVIKNRWGE